MSGLPPRERALLDLLCANHEGNLILAASTRLHSPMRQVAAQLRLKGLLGFDRFVPSASALLSWRTRNTSPFINLPARSAGEGDALALPALSEPVPSDAAPGASDGAFVSEKVSGTQLADEIEAFCTGAGTSPFAFLRFARTTTSVRALWMTARPTDATVRNVRYAFERWGKQDAVTLRPGAGGQLQSTEIARRRAEAEAAHEARATRAREVAESERSEREARRRRMAAAKVPA